MEFSTARELLEFSYNYVFTTIPIAKIQPIAAIAVKDFATALIALILAALHVVACCVLVLFKLSILAFPHAIKLGRVVYNFHRTQLSWSDILLEVLSLTLLVLYFAFRRRIIRFWQQLEANISAKSKKAAEIAPHALFFFGAFIFAIFGRKFILPFISTTMMPCFTLVLPLLSSLRLSYTAYTQLYAKNNPLHDTEALLAKQPKFVANLMKVLTLWVILAIYHGLVTICHVVIPFSVSSRLLLFLPYGKEMVLVILLWIQLSAVFTDIVYVSIIAPLMVYLSRYIPTAQYTDNNHPAHTATTRRHGTNTPTAQTNDTWIQKLLFKSLLQQISSSIACQTDAYFEIFYAIMQDSVVSLLAMLLIFLPDPFASIGMVMIACLIPAYRCVTVTATLRPYLPTTAATMQPGSSRHSTTSISGTRQSSVAVTRSGSGSGSGLSLWRSRGTAGTTGSSSSVVAATSPLQLTSRSANSSSNILPPSPSFAILQPCLFHLHYWMSFASLWLIRIYLLRAWLWPSVMILLLLAGQHRFFQGSDRLIQYTYGVMMVLIERNEETQTQRRQQERQQQLQQEGQQLQLIQATPDTDRTVAAEEEEEALSADQEQQLIAEQQRDTLLLASPIVQQIGEGEEEGSKEEGSRQQQLATAPGVATEDYVVLSSSAAVKSNNNNNDDDHRDRDLETSNSNNNDQSNTASAVVVGTASATATAVRRRNNHNNNNTNSALEGDAGK